MSDRYKVTWNDQEGRKKESKPLHLEHAELLQQELLSNHLRADIERIITKESVDLGRGTYQIYLDGFGIFPNVPEEILMGSDLIDGFGNPVDSVENGRTVKRYPDPKGMECLFPLGGHPCYIVVEDGVVTGAFSDQLPQIPIVTRERWNKEWEWASNHDLSKYISFTVSPDE